MRLLLRDFFQALHEEASDAAPLRFARLDRQGENVKDQHALAGMRCEVYKGKCCSSFDDISPRSVCWSDNK